MASRAGKQEDHTSPLPLQLAAEFIEVDIAEMRRLTRSLGIGLQRLGPHDKRIGIVDALRVARVARGASMEEVAGEILDWTEQYHLDEIDRVIKQLNEFFAVLPKPASETATTVS